MAVYCGRLRAVLREQEQGNDRECLGAAVLGAGPAGLTAATVLARRGVPTTVLEADGAVGGIAKTVEFDGFRFDLGGHRFYTKLEPIQRLWEDMLGPRVPDPPPMSRIYYRDRFFTYPLRAKDVFKRARRGRVRALRALILLWSWRLRAIPRRPSRSGWGAGSGAGCTTRSSARTPRRSGGSRDRRSSPSGRRSASRTSQPLAGDPGRSWVCGQESPPTLIEEFRYPRLGPGQMWEAFAARRRSAASRYCSTAPASVSTTRSGRAEHVVVRRRRRRAEYPSRRCSRASPCPS